MSEKNRRGYRCLGYAVVFALLAAATPAGALTNLNLDVACPGGPFDRGATVDVCVSINAATPLVAGDNCLGFSFDLRFDPTILEYVGTQAACVPAISYPASGWTLDAATVLPINSVRVVGSGVDALTGSGGLITLRFRVLAGAVPGACTDLVIMNAQFAGTSIGGTWTPCHCCVNAVKISGDVSYWRGAACAAFPPVYPVPCVTVELRGDPGCTAGPLQNSVITGGSCTANGPTAGHYEIGSENGINTHLCFKRTNTDLDYDDVAPKGDVGGAITISDALEIHRYYLGLTTLQDCPINGSYCGPVYPQQIAADVDGLGGVTMQDAGYIRQMVRYIQNKAFPWPAGVSKDWKFYCDHKDYTPISPPDKTVNVIAVLPGDITGSYANDADYGKPRPGLTLAVSEPQVLGRAVLVPVRLDGSPGDLGSFQVRLEYDPAVLRFVAGYAGDRAPTALVDAAAADGMVVLMSYTTDPRGYRNPGTLAMLQFERLTADGVNAHSPLALSGALVGEQPVQMKSGWFSTSSVAARSWGAVKQLYRE